MPRVDNEVRITPSLLDRLLDDQPELSHEPPASRSRSLRQLKQSIQRDLEWLLNTRRLAEELPPGLTEVNRSLVIYGLPDFSTANIKSPADQSRLCRAIESTIRLFEPRLDQVVVTLDVGRDDYRTLCFRIDAQLRVEPAPEPVTFDTLLQLQSGQYVVQGA